MTKIILLRGGPDDGQTPEISAEKSRYYTIQSLMPGKGILLGMRKGTYLTTGEFSGDYELFTWQGWDDEKNKSNDL